MSVSNINNVGMENLFPNMNQGGKGTDIEGDPFQDIFMSMVMEKGRANKLGYRPAPPPPPPRGARPEELKDILAAALEEGDITTEEYEEALAIIEAMEASKDSEELLAIKETLQAGGELTEKQLAKLDDMMESRKALDAIMQKVVPPMPKDIDETTAV